MCRREQAGIAVISLRSVRLRVSLFVFGKNPKDL
jgi:hypothetical protein